MTAPRPRKRRWIRVAALVGVYLVLASCMPLADKLILFPSTGRVPAPGATRHVVRMDSGAAIEVWRARSRVAGEGTPAFVFVEFTGNATRAEEIAPDTADRWRDLSVEVFAVNYPGYGGSDGPARLAAIGPAALGAFDDAAAIAGDAPVIVVGTSLGTAAALHVAAHRPVDALILANPPPLRQLILGRYGWWNLWLAAMPVALQVPASLDSLAQASLSTAPAVFITSGRDEIVPHRYQRRVVDAYAGPKRVIHLPDARHNDPAADEVDEAIRAALLELLAAPRRGAAGGADSRGGGQ